MSDKDITFTISQTGRHSVTLSGARGTAMGVSTVNITLTPISGTAVTYTAIIPDGENNGVFEITGLEADTTYTIAYSGNIDEGPSSVTTLTDDPKVATESMWEDLVSKVKAKADSSNLATVATSGSYNDLSNKPTIPSIKSQTGSTTFSDISTLYVAGDGTTTTPMALKTHGNNSNGSYAYVNINEPTSAISSAYVGGCVWDNDESWWQKLPEVRLALYSDVPTITMTTTDPGEGVALAENHFIAVYSAS